MISTANNPTLAAAMATAAKRRQEEPTALEAAPASLQALEAENARLRDENEQSARTEAQLLASNERLTNENRKLKSQTRHAAPPVIEGELVSLDLKRIRRGGGTQMREGMNEETVQRYAEALEAGDVFPPIKVMRDDEDRYWLVDGFHRLEAYQRMSVEEVACDVIRGAQREAVMRAAGANKEHDKAGLRRTNADKRRAVTTLLEDAEWRNWANNKIAQWCGVSDKTVDAVRKSIFGNSEDRTTPAPASSKMPSATPPPRATRMVTRNGTSYPMAVGRIGAKAASSGSTRRVTDDYAQAAPDDVPSVDVDSDTNKSTDKMLDILTNAQAGENSEAKARRLGFFVPETVAPVRPAMAAHYSSASDEWYTPLHIIERVLRLWNVIDLDPCSNSHEQPNVPAKTHYTRADDGLAQDWAGRVFVNPPYGEAISDWIDKALVEAGKAATDLVLLVPARTDTAWMSKLDEFPRCYVRGRLKFVGAENSAPFPSCVVYIGANVAGFCAAFRDLGGMFVPMEA